MNSTDNKRSTLKIVLIVSAIVVAVSAATIAIVYFIRKSTKKMRSVVLGKLDFNGDGRIDAVMLDTTGDGEVDTIILNEDTCEIE